MINRIDTTRRQGTVWISVVLWIAIPASAAEPPITDLAFAPDGKSLVGCSQAGVHVFNWPELERQKTIDSSAANLHCLVFSASGDRLAVGGGNPSEEGIVEVFDWPSGELATKIVGHDDSILAIAWQGESALITASLDRDVKLWDLQKRVPRIHYQGHSRGVAAVCLLNDGKTLVSTGQDQSLRVWNTETSEIVRSLNQHTKPVHDLALRPGEEGLPMIASAAGDRTVRFWQPTIGRMVRYIRLESEPLSIAWIGNGSQIAAACVDGQVRVIEADEVRVTHNLPAIDGWAYAIALHPTDGSLAVGGSDGQLRRVIPK